jgi:hypothetical protein
MHPAIALPETPTQPRRRGRWQLLLLLAIVIGPMLLASAMYHWRFWVPESRSYHGELIGNGQTRADLGVAAGEEPRWQLLVTAPSSCDTDCRQLVFLARQIHIGLNRDASRASHALASTQPLSADYDAELRRGYPQLLRFQLEPQAYGRIAGETEAAQLWIVDPLGNLVLRYDAGSKGKGVLDDLRYLLKISQID